MPVRPNDEAQKLEGLPEVRLFADGKRYESLLDGLKHPPGEIEELADRIDVFLGDADRLKRFDKMFLNNPREIDPLLVLSIANVSRDGNDIRKEGRGKKKRNGKLFAGGDAGVNIVEDREKGQGGNFPLRDEAIDSGEEVSQKPVLSEELERLARIPAFQVFEELLVNPRG